MTEISREAAIATIRNLIAPHMNNIWSPDEEEALFDALRALGRSRPGGFEEFQKEASARAWEVPGEDCLDADAVQERAVEMALWAYAAGAGEWVSVEERLPEDPNLIVLTYAPRLPEGNWNIGMAVAGLDEGRYPWTDDITHWRPLPAPPSEGGPE